MDSILNLYVNYHPDFLESLDTFPENIKSKILRNLRNAKNRSSFLSTIAEIQFGIFFSNLGFQLEYEKKYPNKQTPDWTVSIDNAYSICDVYRLGKSAKDQIRSDFENHLIEKLKELPYKYLIRIHFINEYFDSLKFDIDLIVSEFDCWLKKSIRKVGEKIMIKGNFEFEIAKSNTKNNHLSCTGNANSIDIKLGKLIQFEHLKPNEITKKLIKYNLIISENQFPYFIAVSIDFINGFDFSDFSEYFLGKGVDFIDFGTPLGNLSQFKHLGENWTELGAFYDNPQLSGIITLYNNEFKILVNPNKNQVLYMESNLKLFEKLSALLDLY